MEYLGVKACFPWNFLGQSDKSKNSRGGGGFRKLYPQPPYLDLDLSRNSPMLSILIEILTIDDMQDDTFDMLGFL